MINWEKKKLGEVCVVERGSSPRPIQKYQTDSPDGVNWIKIGDTKGVEKYIFSTREKITKEGAEKSRYVKEGDFILSNSMSFGKPYIMKTDGYIHDGWFVFRLPDYLDKDYFYHLLTSPNVQEQIQSLGAGAIVKNISGDLVKKVDITFPKSLQEQQRIVAILDEAFAAIGKAKANAEQNLKNAAALFESYLQGVFENPKDNWEVCNLETYIKLIDYRGRTPVKTESGVRLITAKNVKLGYLQLEPQEFIANNNYESWMSRGIPNFGDVIFTTEAPLANVAQIDTLDNVAFAQRIIVMQPKPSKLNQTFLKYMLLSNPIRNKILDKGTGATVLGIKSSLLKKIEIYFPSSINEQQKIVEKLEALSAETKKLEAIYKQKINDLEELKKSVLQKAFSGELKTAKMELL
jgi:type I restriction enzyme S subunit